MSQTESYDDLSREALERKYRYFELGDDPQSLSHQKLVQEIQDSLPALVMDNYDFSPLDLSEIAVLVYNRRLEADDIPDDLWAKVRPFLGDPMQIPNSVFYFIMKQIKSGQLKWADLGPEMTEAVQVMMTEMNYH